MIKYEAFDFSTETTMIYEGKSFPHAAFLWIHYFFAMGGTEGDPSSLVTISDGHDARGFLWEGKRNGGIYLWVVGVA